MPLKVKICGITNLEDARFCAGAGADYLGFIQYPGSPRFVDPTMAKGIIDWIYGPEPVGVFVHEDPDTINRIADETGFALVQLHGDEPPAACAQIERPVIKTISVGEEDTPERLRERMQAYEGHVAFFLLDTRSARWGGTGTAFDWRQARSLSSAFPLFLAGGISPDNVEEAVRTVRPMGVDLSSSLEEAPGRKDFDKVQAFFETVHALRNRMEKIEKTEGG